MAVDDYDNKTGRPIFLGGSAPQTAIDLTAIGKYAAEVGTRLIGTTAQRNAYKYARKGLAWYDTDSGDLYVHNGTGWQTDTVYGYLRRDKVQTINNNWGTTCTFNNDAETKRIFRGGVTKDSDALVAPVSGVYEVRAGLTYRGDATSTEGERNIQLRRNNAIPQYAVERTASPHSTQPLTLTRDLELDAGDKISVVTLQTSGKALTIMYRTFSIQLIVRL